MILALEIVVAVAVLVGIVFAVTRGDGRADETSPRRGTRRDDGNARRGSGSTAYAGGLDDVGVDSRDIGLPAGRLLRADDVAGLRFRAVSGLRGALRGYRFADVDAAMAKVEETLRAHESRSAPLASGSDQPRRPDGSGGGPRPPQSQLGGGPAATGGAPAPGRVADPDRPPAE